MVRIQHSKRNFMSSTSTNEIQKLLQQGLLKLFSYCCCGCGGTSKPPTKMALATKATSTVGRLTKSQFLLLFICILSVLMFLFQVRVWNHQEQMLYMTKTIGILTKSIMSSKNPKDVDNGGVDGVDQRRQESQKNNFRKVPFKKLSTLNCDSFLRTYPYSAISSSSITTSWSQTLQDIVYWYDIPTDAQYMNPFQKLTLQQQQQQQNHNDTEKYYLFEHDGAGWNNVRMSFENSIILGISTGRTIVLPPKQPISMFRKTNQHTHRFAMNEIYDFDHIQKEFEKVGIHVLTMTEFLEQVVMKGKLLNHRKNPMVVFPPGNKTRWEEEGEEEDLEELKEWLRNTIYSEPWDSADHFVFWPDEEHILNRMEYNLTLTKQLKYYDYVDHPVPVNATMMERMNEFRSGGGKSRDKAVMYKGQIEKEKVILFKTGLYEGGRFLAPFYTFHFFQDWRQDLWSKRFVRDHLRYNDDIMCAAARIVAEIKDKIREKRNLHVDGLENKIEFHSMHIRRGDFNHAYKHTQNSAQQYFEMSKKRIEPNSTIYIATDERNKSFFQPFMDHYQVFFLDDFAPLLQGFNPNLYGMVEQVIVAQGKTFHGTELSTFSAYINRLRGYYSIRKRSEGYEKGIIKSYVFSDNEQFKFDKYKPIRSPFWMKEFQAGWRDIDHGIEDHSSI